MPSPRPPLPVSEPDLPALPSWILRAPAAEPTGAAAAFHAGAVLSHLHGLAMERAEGVPMALLRDRLALAAAEAGLVRAGGRARIPELRDRLCFLPAGAAMDPEMARLAAWRQAGSARLRGDGLARLPAGTGGEAVPALAVIVEEAAPEDDPVVCAAAVLERVRASGGDAGAGPDAVTMLADAALARSLGWPVLLPLLSTGLGRRDLHLEGEALRHACRLALLRGAPRVARTAADLARRAARLHAVAPKLRAKASDAAVALFLARDAVAPTMDLTPTVRGTRVPMSPRAAARLCDRLVDLGAVRELTGRATFRLYGV